MNQKENKNKREKMRKTESTLFILDIIGSISTFSKDIFFKVT